MAVKNAQRIPKALRDAMGGDTPTIRTMAKKAPVESPDYSRGCDDLSDAAPFGPH
jgi:hypothetical protein